ncbi:hypothetical protein [Actinomadura montaniterrae]|uniref:hypothetical protein n=1 Tax=Actinomadura montaniterrae TaxID=1803903 RepID=UPI00178C6338|nr:hypothetical protein [Actinomadura montaniterrae]
MWAARILGPDRALARSAALRALAVVQPSDPDPSCHPDGGVSVASIRDHAAR